MHFYYRTYIVWFTTSTNRFVYGGQHISKFINADDDDYRGSGRVILNALKKYGQDCIQFIQWFDHDSDSAMNQAEIELIANLKSCYGKQCVNIAGGGEGNTWRYASEEQRAEWARRAGDGLRGKPSKLRGRKRPNISKALTGKPNPNKGKPSPLKGRKQTEEARRNLSKAKKGKKNPKLSAYKKGRPTTEAHRKAVSAAMKGKPSTNRGPAWKVYDELYCLWIKAGMLKMKKFSTWLRKNSQHNFIYSQLQTIVPSFEEKIKGKTMTPDLSLFFTTDEEGNEVELPRPETKSWPDVIQCINHHQGRNDVVVNRFIELYLIGIQWDWFAAYKDWLKQCDQVTAYNETLQPDEDGTQPELMPLPIMPEKPQVETVEQVLLREANTLRIGAYNGYRQQFAMLYDSIDGWKAWQDDIKAHYPKIVA